MKVSKIQQLLIQQDNHDKQYHMDIYYQNPLFKLKHFSLHYSKYLSRLIINESNIDLIMVDTLLITLSVCNTLQCSVENIDLQNGINIDLDITKDYARTVEKLTKALDSIDHIEKYNPREELELIPNMFLQIIQSYINSNNITNFEELVLKRYQVIRDKRLC